MVLFACYNLNGSRLKPCFNHKLEFFAVFQLLLLWRSLKKILLVWFQPFGTFTWNAGHTLNAYPKTDVFVCLLLSVAFFECFFLYLIIIQYALFFFFSSQVQIPQVFTSAALLFNTQSKLRKRVICSAYLHQLSCHKILLKNFHFSQGRSSTRRLLLSLQLPKSACRTEQDDGKTSQVQLRI